MIFVYYYYCCYYYYSLLPTEILIGDDPMVLLLLNYRAEMTAAVDVVAVTETKQRVLANCVVSKKTS